MYRVLIAGVPVECDDAEEAKRLALSMAHKGEGSKRRVQAKDSSPREKDKRRGGFKSPQYTHVMGAYSLKMLNAIKDAGPSGIVAERLAGALGFRSSKALGPITATVNQQLAQSGIKLDDVVVRRRVGKDRTWFATEGIEKAIKTFQK
jgi:hypothetical protein